MVAVHHGDASNALARDALVGAIIVVQIQIVFLSVYLLAGAARRTLWGGSRPRRRRKIGQEQRTRSYWNCSLGYVLEAGGAGESNRREGRWTQQLCLCHGDSGNV